MIYNVIFRGYEAPLFICCRCGRNCAEPLFQKFVMENDIFLIFTV